MRRILFATGASVLLVMLGALSRGRAFAADPAPTQAAFTKDSPQVLDYTEFHKRIQPFLNTYCIACHSAQGTEPDIRFDLFTDQTSLEKWTPMLDKAVTMLRDQKMPPKGKLQPDREQHDAVLAWLEAYTTGIDCSNPALRNPGRVTLHRLNRAEYNNTIHDLLGLDIKPAEAFPVDDAGYGFDNIGDVLSIAPMLMEKYLNAAGVMLDKSIFCDPIIPPPLMHWDAATMEGTVPKSDPKAVTGSGNFGRAMLNGRIFNYSGEITADYDFPADGEYTLRFRGYGQLRPMVQFAIDGQSVGKPVLITEDQPNTKVYGLDKMKLSAGRHRLSIIFPNGATREEYEVAAAAAAAKAATQPAAAPTTAPAPLQAANAEDTAAADAAAPAARPQPAVTPQQTIAVDPAGAAAADPASTRPAGTRPARGRGARGARGRGAPRGGVRRGPPPSLTGKPTIGVVYVEVEGPLEITPERMPPAYRKVMVAHPSATVSKAEAAQQIIRNFATRAFRRPVTEPEVAQLMGIWSKYDAAGETFEASVHTTLQGVLVSPYFLFRYERDPGPDDADHVRTLDEFELASRLSYFLWSTMPDEELFHLAQEGQLRANLDSQVQRMMKDPRSRALVDNFAGQWLKLRLMDSVSPDAKTFPGFDESLRQAMITETQMFFLAIMQENRSILEFIDADFTFLNERLAKHYGIEGVTGEQFRRVKLPSDQRGGILTQASVLTITSYPARTSPVQRGKWVLENLFDQSPPPPPPDIPALKEHGEIKGTLRQRMEQHRSNPACATCHEQMDAIGFGLENFDAIGAWRTDDGGSTIDPAGSLPGGQQFKGPAELRQIIKSRQDDFCRTMSTKMLTYALGRGLEKYDKCTVDDIVGAMKQDGYKFSVLVNQIVHSDPFQKRAAQQ